MHLDDENIAKLIDGKASQIEKKEYLDHISNCEECFEIYSDSIKSLRNLKSKNIMFLSLLQSRKYISLLAASILIFVVGIFYITKSEINITGTTIKTTNYIKSNLLKYGDSSSYGFTQNETVFFNVVRLGIMAVDIESLSSAKKNKIFLELKDLIKEDLIKIDKALLINREILISNKLNPKIIIEIKKMKYMEYYIFGRILEKTIFEAIEGRFPLRNNIEKLENIVIDKTVFPKKIKTYLIEISKSNNLRIIKKKLESIKSFFLN